MSRIKVPCKGCGQRHMGCHSECESYATYRRENAKRGALIKSQKARTAEVQTYIVSCINKNRRTKEKTHIGYKKGR